MALDFCRFWKCWGLKVGIVDLRRGSDDLRDEFVDRDIPIYALPTGHRGIFRYLDLTVGAFRLVRRFRPTAVLSTLSGLHAVVLMGSRLAGCANTVVHQGVYPWFWKRGFWKYKAEYQIGRPFVARVVACSRYVADGVVEHFGVPAARVEVVYNGVLASSIGDELADRSTANLGNIPVVTMVGRIDQTKDYDLLISAAAICRDQGLVVHWRFIGDGEDRVRLEARVKQLGLSDQVEFLGWRKDLPALLRTSSIFA